MKKLLIFIVVFALVISMCGIVAYADGSDAMTAATETYKAQIFSLLREIVTTIVMALAGYVGICIKKLFQRYVDTDEKRNIAKICVNFVEQVYTELHGDAKLNIAIKYATIILTEKGIPINETELRTLLEAAVKEMNDKIAEATPAKTVKKAPKKTEAVT